MIRKPFGLLILAAFFTFSCSTKPKTPKLVITLVVDQLRPDLLTRFENCPHQQIFKFDYKKMFVEKIINTAIPDSNKGAGIEWSSGANAPELNYVFNKRNTF